MPGSGEEERAGLIKSLIEPGAKVARHGQRWQVHVVSAFPLFDITGPCSAEGY